MKMYYSHSMQLYNTPQEQCELEFIRKKFPTATVICPNNDLGELSSIKEYLKIVDNCNMVIASEVDGFIGKGLLCEVARAFANGTQVRVIREKGGRLILCDVIGFKIENGADWKYRYAKLI